MDTDLRKVPLGWGNEGVLKQTDTMKSTGKGTDIPMRSSKW